MDYVAMIAPLFNYQRGSLKFVVYTPEAATGLSKYLRVGLSNNRFGTAPMTYGDLEASDSSYVPLAIATGPPIAGGVSFYVPQYSRTQSEMYRLYTSTYTQPTDLYCSDLRVFLKTGGGTIAGTKILRQAGDDWSCGFFTGCLPIDRSIGVFIPTATF